MPFETFKRQRTTSGQEPSVTIQRKGVLSLNLPAYRVLGEPEAVELLYDPVERLIGLRKVDPEVRHSYLVRGLGRNETNTTWLISGTAFTKYYGIDTTKAKRWAPLFVNETLVIDLKV